jgi:hypothetical protein
MAEDLRELSEIEKIKQRIAELDKQAEKYAQRSSQYSKKKLQEVQAEKKEQDALLKVEEKRATGQKALQKEQSAFAKSFFKLNNDVKKLLVDQNTESSIYQSIGNDIAKSKVKQLNLAGQELEAEMEREQYLSEINSSLLQQAQATAKAEADAKGLNEFEQKKLELKQNALGLSDEELKRAEAAVDLQEQMFLKQQRLNELEKIQGDLMSQMPAGLQSAIGFAKGLGNAIKAGMGPLFLVGAVIAAAVKSFMDLESAAADFRKETGLTNSQMEGIRSQANQITGEFAEIGLEAKDVFDTVAALKSEFSDTAEFSDEVVAGLSVLSKNFGVSAESAAKVQGVLEQVSGLSSETAASVQLQVANMAKLAGVAPAKVMADIAESAEIASTLFKGDVNALAKSAIEARRLGTNLKSVAATAEKLLDFEGGIEEELTAATYVGGQFNLSRARALAFEGKIVEAQKETLAQIQKSGDFRKKDYFTQQQLAKAAGISVEEINKQLNAQEKLNSLSDEQKKLAEDAISKGLDITNIDKEQLATQVEVFSKQQEQQATLEKISNQFMGIASTVGSVLVPVLDAVALLLNIILSPIMLINDMFGYIGEKIGSLIGPLGTVGKILKGLAGLAILYAAYSAFASLSAIPVVGSVLGGIAAAAIIAAGFGFLSKVGDLSSPADGKTQVSTKEGGLFELSPNDDLVAAPGAATALANANGGGEGGGGGINLSALAAPMQAMVNEVKALRADLSAGKIAVYMDAQKVTNGVSRVVDQSTRNSYNLGTV